MPITAMIIDISWYMVGLVVFQAIGGLAGSALMRVALKRFSRDIITTGSKIFLAACDGCPVFLCFYSACNLVGAPREEF